MNPNVFSAYALISRFKSLGVSHAVVSPGSRSTPLAYVANDLLETHVVIDERDAGFLALGISEATAMPCLVITTSGSAPTHLFPSITESFYSNIPLIVLTADRPHEVRGRGAPQTIDQINLYGTHVRYFADALCPHDESSQEYWQSFADEMFSASTGQNSPAGPVHLNIGMREPLVPDGDEKQSLLSSQGLDAKQETKASTFGFSAIVPNKKELLESQVQNIINNAKHGAITIGRNSGVTARDVRRLRELIDWPILADVTSNVRSEEALVCNYDSVLRRSDSKNLHPDVVIQFGDPLTSKLWNESISDVFVISIRTQDDGKDPYGNADICLHARDISSVFDEIARIDTSASKNFRILWEKISQQTQKDIEDVISKKFDSEPSAFFALGESFSKLESPFQILIASSMPIRYSEMLWNSTSSDSKVFSHRGTNGIDGMISSTFGISIASQCPTVCVLGDVAFSHDIGFLSTGSSFSEFQNKCVIFVVVDNGGGAIFGHLEQGRNPSMADSYDKIMKTPSFVDIEEISKASKADYFYGSVKECVTRIEELLKSQSPGTHVVHMKFKHDSGKNFMTELNARLSNVIE